MNQTIALTILLCALRSFAEDSTIFRLTDTNRFLKNVYAAGLLVAKPTPGGRLSKNGVDRRDSVVSGGLVTLRDSCGLSSLRYQDGLVEMSGNSNEMENATTILKFLEGNALPVSVLVGFGTNVLIAGATPSTNALTTPQEVRIEHIVWLPLEELPNGETTCASVAGFYQCGTALADGDIELSLVAVHSLRGVPSLFVTLYSRNHPEVLTVSMVCHTNEQTILTIRRSTDFEKNELLRLA